MRTGYVDFGILGKLRIRFALAKEPEHGCWHSGGHAGGGGTAAGGGASPQSVPLTSGTVFDTSCGYEHSAPDAERGAAANRATDRAARTYLRFMR